MWREVFMASALIVAAGCADEGARSVGATRPAAPGPSDAVSAKGRGARDDPSRARAAPATFARLGDEAAREAELFGAPADEDEADTGDDEREAEARDDEDRDDEREAEARDDEDRDDERPLRPLRPEGTVKGRITRVRPDTLYIGSDRGSRRVDGTPYDLGELSAGDAVEVPYREVGERAWLWPARSAEERPPEEAYAVRGSVVGPVTEVDRERGLLGIGRLRLRAHPTDLVEVGLGQVLEVRFVEIAGRIWVHSLAPTWSRTAPGARDTRR